MGQQDRRRLSKRLGLERGKKRPYIVDERTSQKIEEALEKAGIDVRSYLASGQLSVLTKEDGYI